MHLKKASKKMFSVSLMTIRKWHWMSASLCFICMLLFSVTGISLHHTKLFLPKPTLTHTTGQLPVEFLAALNKLKAEPKNIVISEAMAAWFLENQQLNIAPLNKPEMPKPEMPKQEAKAPERKSQGPEIKEGKLVVPVRRPGVASVLSINIETGEFDIEITNKGWLAYFNDLHKGSNTGMAWVYFTDVFAIACIIFSITGFLLLQRYANTRAQTWPLLIAGLLLPIFFMMFLVHQ